MSKDSFCMKEGCMKALCAFCFMEDHKGHEQKRKKLQTVFKEFKQEVAVAIETIDGKIREL